MTPLQALQEANALMQSIIESAPISADQRRWPTPCRDFDVEQLGEHIIDTHNLLLSGAGGKPSPTVGKLSERHRAVASDAIEQWAVRGTDGVIDLGGNELPAAFGLSLHTLEMYIHGWDLAKALGRPFDPSRELTDQMWEFARSFISDDVRGDFDGAPYRAAVAIEDGDVVAQIMAHAGRDPLQPISARVS